MPQDATADSRGVAVLRVALLGNDALAAVAPATPVQLMHACQRAGYGLVLPPNWGDELVAAEALRQLDGTGRRAAVLVACPHVAARLEALPEPPDATLVCVVAPPVAAARQLRRLGEGQPMHVTYVGGCPDAEREPSIDARVLPDEFVRGLVERGIGIGDMPRVFEDVIPPDRRRHVSLPGGVPSPAAVLGQGGPSLTELDGAQAADAARWPAAARGYGLVDAAAGLGCACSGCTPGRIGSSARAAAVAADPPRSPSAVVQAAPGLNLQRRLTSAVRETPARVTPARVTPERVTPVRVTPVAVPVVEQAVSVEMVAPAPSSPPPPARPAAAPVRARPPRPPEPEPPRRRIPLPALLVAMAVAIGAVALLARLTRPVARASEPVAHPAPVPAPVVVAPAPAVDTTRAVADGATTTDTVSPPSAEPVPRARSTTRRPRTPLPPIVATPTPAATTAPPDSEAIEREAIRREIEARRRRIDSIERRLDSLRRP